MTNDYALDLATLAKIDVVPRILEVICRTTGLGFSAVARVTEDRWIACAVRDEIAFGLKPGGELQVETTICDEIRDSGQLVVIDHVAEDETFRDHKTPKMYGFQSYISVPIYLRGGQFFGTLCAIDPRPARLNTVATVGMFKLFAELIAFHIESQDRLTASELELRNERETADLREQFIAVVGHDLRNPLASIEASAEVLLTLPLGERAIPAVQRIKRSAGRMAGLIANVLDFARGRLSGGLSLSQKVEAHLETTLEHVVAELQSAWPSRAIEYEFALHQPVCCDGARLAQMFSNLLANALTHGDPAGPVRVLARSDAEAFELSVANTGRPIPPDTFSHLFQPFSRASVGPGQQGLGLGLYIASEIARAHGGSLTVASSPEETRFTFRMPVSGSASATAVSATSAASAASPTSVTSPTSAN
jgi:signal transduction histidine kinase